MAWHRRGFGALGPSAWLFLLWQRGLTFLCSFFLVKL